MCAFSKKILTGFFIFFMMSVFTGCSVIGYSLGAAADSDKPEYAFSKIPGLNAEHTPIGLQTRSNFRRFINERVFITLTNNQSLTCKILSVEKKEGHSYFNILRGSENHQIAFQDILCLQTMREKLEYQNLDLIITTIHGKSMIGKYRSVMMEENQVYLIVDIKGGEQTILCEDIAHIRYKNKRNSAKTGFFVGLAFDAAAVAAFSTMDIDLNIIDPMGGWEK